jgi:hypothetical protein
MKLHLSLLPLLLACSAGEEMRADYARLELSSIDYVGVETALVFEVSNPNPIGIQLADFAWSLSVSGQPWASGAGQEGLSVQAIDEHQSELRLPLRLSYDDLYEVVGQGRGQDVLPFEIRGQTSFSSPVGALDLPFAGQGELPALIQPTFSLEALELASLEAGGARLDLILAVDNAQGSALTFQSFDYELSLLGQPAADGLVEQLGVVDGDATASLRLPINLDFDGGDSDLAEALLGDSLAVELRAHTEVEGPHGLIPLDLQVEGEAPLR